MSEPGSPTLDQLQIFLAVVEEGSFAAAGRRLNRAVSVISYGVSNLEAQLGLTLFTREGTKRPVLTPEGEAILADARVVAAGLDGLRARARGLLEGLEAEVSLAVDVMLPAHVTGVQTCALPIWPVSAEGEGLDRMDAGAVTLVPVAAPDHPLARETKLKPGAGRDHIQLVLTDRSPLTQGRDFAVQSPHTWRLADLGAKHALLREGIGWGNMPLPMIEGDLVAGTLVRLAMPDDTGGTYRFSTIHRSDVAPGPATAWLMERFVGPGIARPASASKAD